MKIRIKKIISEDGCKIYLLYFHLYKIDKRNTLFVKIYNLYSFTPQTTESSILNPESCSNTIEQFKNNIDRINQIIDLVTQDVSKHIVTPESYDDIYVEDEKDYIETIVEGLKALDNLRQQKKQLLLSSKTCISLDSIPICYIKFSDLDQLLQTTSAKNWVKYESQVDNCKYVIQVLRKSFWDFGVNFNNKSSHYLNIVSKTLNFLKTNKNFQNKNLLSNTLAVIETGRDYTINYINRTVHDNFDIVDKYVECGNSVLVREFKLKMHAEINIPELNRMRLYYHGGLMNSTLKLTHFLPNRAKNLYYHSLSSFYLNHTDGARHLQSLSQHIADEKKKAQPYRYYEDILWFEISRELQKEVERTV